MQLRGTPEAPSSDGAGTAALEDGAQRLGEGAAGSCPKSVGDSSKEEESHQEPCPRADEHVDCEVSTGRWLINGQIFSVRPWLQALFQCHRPSYLILPNAMSSCL